MPAKQPVGLFDCVGSTEKLQGLEKSTQGESSADSSCVEPRPSLSRHKGAKMFKPSSDEDKERAFQEENRPNSESVEADFHGGFQAR